MSRIGKRAVAIPSGVTANIDGKTLSVKGPKGTLDMGLSDLIEYTLEDGEFFLILPFTPEEGVRVIAERIRRTIAEQNWPLAGKVTVSLGCTTRASTDIRTADLRKRVRHALEEARKRGADSVWYSQGDVRPS